MKRQVGNFKQYYYERKAKGVCVICCTPTSIKEDGTLYVKCDKCREYERAARASLTAAGLCKSCGKPLNGDKHKYCNVCRKKDKVYRELKGKEGLS